MSTENGAQWAMAAVLKECIFIYDSLYNSDKVIEVKRNASIGGDLVTSFLNYTLEDG